MSATLDLTLEIHHMDVTGGDSTAIVIKDRAKNEQPVMKVLIDTGAEGGGSDWLITYLQKYFKSCHFDYVIASHYHQDHIKGFNKTDITFSKYIDIGGYNMKGVNFKPKNGVGGVQGNNTFVAYQGSVRRSVDDPKIKAERVDLPFIWEGSNVNADAVKIPLVGDITLTCYSANGIVADGKNQDNNIAASQKTKWGRAFNPNDLCLAFVLEWPTEKFIYFTAGDLSGDEEEKHYYNIEESLVDYLVANPLKDKKVSVFKVSHHGSQHSNLTTTFDSLAPETIIISCNLIKDVPHQNFLSRLNSYLGLPANNNSNNNAIGRTVALSNDVFVNKKDPRYQPFSDLMPAVAAKNLEKKSEDQSISNLAVKSVVIRRRTNGVVDPNEQIDDLLARTLKSSHEIILIKRDPNEVRQAEAEAARVNTFQLPSFSNRPSNLDLSQSGYKNVGESITTGFNNQTEKMLAMVKADKEKKTSTGYTYIKTHYPSLAPLIEDFLRSDSATGDTAYQNLKVEVSTLIHGYFDEAYTYDDSGEGLFKYDPGNGLALDEKETLFNSLYNNVYQQLFNVVNIINNYPPSNPRTWYSNFAWNSAELYGGADDPNSQKRQRQAESMPIVRKSSRLNQ